MSWSDKLASTSGLGFALTPHHTSGMGLLDAIAPILDRAKSREGTGFDVQALDQFNAQIVTNEGYQYAMNPRSVGTEYVYRVHVQNQSGAAPVAKFLSTIIPYSRQLEELTGRLVELAGLMPNASKREIVRLTVMTAASVAPEDLPPGIQGLIRYMGRPWSQQIDAYNLRVAGNLGADEVGNQLRCVHTIGRAAPPETKEPQPNDGLVSVRFDWQRKFKTPRRIEAKAMRELIADGIRDANKYFEEIAAGDRFDENILSSTV